MLPGTAWTKTSQWGDEWLLGSFPGQTGPYLCFQFNDISTCSWTPSSCAFLQLQLVKVNVCICTPWAVFRYWDKVPWRSEGLGILVWPVFRDVMVISSRRAMSEPTCHNNRTISPAMSVFSVLCYGLELVWKAFGIIAASRWDWSLLNHASCLDLLRVRSGSGTENRGESFTGLMISCRLLCDLLQASQKNKKPVACCIQVFILCFPAQRR